MNAERDRLEKTGGTAFPVVQDSGPFWNGLTKRDYFAAMAMQEFMRFFVPLIDEGFFAPIIDRGNQIANIAAASYQMADAMLKESTK